MIRCKILGYWIDSKLKKAYCILEYVDFKQDEKHTNIYLQESDYKGSK